MHVFLRLGQKPLPVAGKKKDRTSVHIPAEYLLLDEIRFKKKLNFFWFGWNDPLGVVHPDWGF